MPNEGEAEVRDRRPDALGELHLLPDYLLCAILECLSPRDVARLSCASSVLYILCNEEPLWMVLCLKDASGLLEYKGSWKETTLYRHNPDKYPCPSSRRLHFDGFSSMFLYKRWYRCFTALDSFSMDKGVVKRVQDLSSFEFEEHEPVLISGLADNWPARHTWTADRLLQAYGETPFRLSQRSKKKVRMRLRDYVSYMNFQHDEDPLYIFDDEFGDVAPNLLKDYSVPYLFQEDYFDALDRYERPPFRWLIIGPARSGASWHVDPGLTSAWNTLLCGQKRWALYPPGKVPIGVTVHVNEEDGDINIDSPSSLQWWLDYYPLLADEDKPIECTQLPGETIFVPSGWWHCVLNLDVTVAVTQNFVNASNFEFVCMDMSPGYLHKGVARAGLLAIRSNTLEAVNELASDNSQFQCSEIMHKEKRPRLCKVEENVYADKIPCPNLTFSYDIEFLSKFLDEERDHYNSVWSQSNCIGQREIRKWLHRLWIGKPALRDLIWKGACLALNAERWSAGMSEICARHSLPCPSFDEKLPVGTGSNPVYLTGEYVIKIYVEDGLESSIHSLATELEFHRLISEVKSPLQDHVPDILASGILIYDEGSYKTYAWDGKGVPDAFRRFEFTTEIENFDNFIPFGVWKKQLLEMKNADNLEQSNVLTKSNVCPNMWPYVISKRCRGDIFAQLRETLSMKEVTLLASFLGVQLRHLHLLPIPSLPDLTLLQKCFSSNFSSIGHVCIPIEWRPFLETLNRRRKYLPARLAQWGDPVPSILKRKIEEYVPRDLVLFLSAAKDENSTYSVLRSPAWIHSDVMDDNIHLDRATPDKVSLDTIVKSCDGGENIKWHPAHILDFSDLSIGDPLLDVIPIYLDVFRGDKNLLDQFLVSYGLPLKLSKQQLGLVEGGDKFNKLSYRAMCYCIFHEDNVLGTIFSLWKELNTATSWEDVEETVWGMLNKYQ